MTGTTTLLTLRHYSEGRITRRQALQALRFEQRDYHHLLRLLGEAGLPIPIHPDSEAMAEEFAKILSEGRDEKS